ncbi:MAG TPA: hypothetical protein VMK12_22455, partial [Anaeromyxobacteraceae bacterium]|nr:hypothetical protein [Anaeromyxobacteraceae bacterium]
MRASRQDRTATPIFLAEAYHPSRTASWGLFRAQPPTSRLAHAASPSMARPRSKWTRVVFHSFQPLCVRGKKAWR